MSIFYETMVYNKFYGLKKVFLVEKKIVNNDFEKSFHFEGGGRGQFGKSLHLDFFILLMASLTSL